MSPTEISKDSGAKFNPPAPTSTSWSAFGGGHNISYDDGDVPAGTAWDGDDEDIYSEGHVHFFTFETPGEYDYYCQPHQTSGMTGSFTVTE